MAAPVGAGRVFAAKLPYARVGTRAAAALIASQRLAAFVAVDERVHGQVGDVPAAVEAQDTKAKAVVGQDDHALI